MLTSALLTRACRGGSTCNLRSHLSLIFRIPRKAHRRQRNEHRGLFWDCFNRISIGLSEHKKNIHILIFTPPFCTAQNGAPHRSVMQKHAFVQRRVRSSKFLFAQNPPDTAAENRFTDLKSIFLRDQLFKLGNYIKVRSFEECFLMDLLYKCRNYMKKQQKLENRHRTLPKICDEKAAD